MKLSLVIKKVTLDLREHVCPLWPTMWKHFKCLSSAVDRLIIARVEGLIINLQRQFGCFIIPSLSVQHKTRLLSVSNEGQHGHCQAKVIHLPLPGFAPLHERAQPDCIGVSIRHRTSHKQPVLAKLTSVDTMLEVNQSHDTRNLHKVRITEGKNRGKK